MGTWSKRQLAQLIERGEYVVDEQAVAEAMLRRMGRTSPVLVAAEPLDRPPVLAEEDEALPSDDLA